MKGKPQERIATWRLSPLQALEGPQTRMRMRTHAQPPPPNGANADISLPK